MASSSSSSRRYQQQEVDTLVPDGAWTCEAEHLSLTMQRVSVAREGRHSSSSSGSSSGGSGGDWRRRWRDLDGGGGDGGGDMAEAALTSLMVDLYGRHSHVDSVRIQTVKTWPLDHLGLRIFN